MKIKLHTIINVMILILLSICFFFPPKEIVDIRIILFAFFVYFIYINRGNSKLVLKKALIKKNTPESKLKIVLNAYDKLYNDYDKLYNAYDKLYNDYEKLIEEYNGLADEIHKAVLENKSKKMYNNDKKDDDEPKLRPQYIRENEGKK